jgi:membrane protein DedA with SNARE-associated domain
MAELILWAQHAAQALVEYTHQFGYFGLFFIGFIEVIPLPTSLVLIPAGYLVQQGQLSFAGVLLAKVGGVVCGAVVNYLIIRRFGRAVLERTARYVGLNAEKISRLELFFAKHGPISILLGRLVPGVRHYLFFPAGLARMNLQKFALYTAIGTTLWTAPLVWLGYHFGANESLALSYVSSMKQVALGLMVVVALAYVALRWRKRRVRV